MKVSEKGILLIKKFEGCRLKAYQDSVGIWTIGYGWTQKINGEDIESSTVITSEMAEFLLQTGVHQYEINITSLLHIVVNQNQFDALTSFSYNVGITALANSTLLKKLNAGNYFGAADEFLKWNKAGGKILTGLTSRRIAERELFLL